MFFLIRYRSTIAEAMKKMLNARVWYEGNTWTIQRIFLPPGRELEVVLLQVARRGGMPKANYGRAPPISIGSDVCKISKCSYIESIFTSYCN